MSSYKNLDEFLRSHKTTKEEGNITHTRIGDKDSKIYPGSYSISDEELDTFYKLYERKVFKSKKPEYLTEVQRKDSKENIPLLIDFDFRYNSTVKQRKHTLEHIQDVCHIYVEGIYKYFDVSKLDSPIDFYIFEKPKANTSDERYTKDGIHIMVNLHMDHIQQQMIRSHVLKDIDTYLDDLGLVNEYTDVLDDGITKGHTNWQLYGSRKPNNDKYELVNILRFNLTYNSIDEDSYQDVDVDIEEVVITNLKPIDILKRCSARKCELIRIPLLEKYKEEYETLASNRNRKIKKTTIRKKSNRNYGMYGGINYS